MTTKMKPGLPFVLTYSEPIERESYSPSLRYNRRRQLSEVSTDDGWANAVSYSDVLAGTRKTAVSQETTDDE